MSDEPILIWGGGAIGGVLAAYWARAGIPVLLVDIVGEHVEACRTVGLKIEGPVEEFTQIVPSVTPDAVKGVYKRIVLAVKVTFFRRRTVSMKSLLLMRQGLNERWGVSSIMAPIGWGQGGSCLAIAVPLSSAKSMGQSGRAPKICSGC
jgi:hypothetical protein